jgi:hypothetical protein
MRLLELAAAHPAKSARAKGKSRKKPVHYQSQHHPDDREANNFPNPD